MLQNITIPEALQGTLANLCFEFLAGSETVAVKVYAMSILANLTQVEPDLKNELKLLIEEQLPYATPAFLSRSHKVLQLL